MSRSAFRSSLTAIALLVVVQSATHLITVGPLDTIDSILDLDRSNGIPDVVSTAVIAVAVGGAVLLALRTSGWERLSATLLVLCLALIGVDDVVGVDRDLAAASTLVVTGATIATTALAVAAGEPGRRSALTMVTGLAALMATLFIGQLPWLHQWFERARGDTIIELQIVVKQGLELVGWSLVALGVWDAAQGARGWTAAVRRAR